MDKHVLLATIKSRLAPVFGNRLQGIVLYGSEARDESTPGSDVDVLVLLTGPIGLACDLQMIVRALYPLQREMLRPIHALPVNAASFEAGEFALYRRARAEGVLA